jgi:hypothetical protein
MWACGSSGGGDAGTGDDAVDVAEAADTAPDPVTGGEFLVLTYNVAGLPEGLSSSHPAEYIPQIGPLLDGYDLVVVQEDFWYHAQLVADVTLPYLSEPMVESPTLTSMGDGLNRMSVFPFGGHERIAWAGC